MWAYSSSQMSKELAKSEEQLSSLPGGVLRRFIKTRRKNKLIVLVSSVSNVGQNMFIMLMRVAAIFNGTARQNRKLN
jgi:hypothetical protein